MSQLIITTDVSSIRPVFVEGTSENIKRYSQLKKLFETSKEYRVFAEPIAAGGAKIAWHTEYEGKIIPFRKLDDEEQNTAKGLLKNEVNKLYKSILAMIEEDDKRKRLFELIDSCIEIPDYDDIYIIQNANGQKNFCIVRWGFINEDFNAPTHLIANLVPLKVANVTIRAIKGNNKMATGEKIFFEINNNVVDYTTDDKAKIYLEDLLLMSKVSAYQLDDNENKIYENSFFVENDAEYTFFIGNQSIPKQSVSIQTMDENDNILPNVTIKINYDDVEFVADTNNQGLIDLGDLFVGTNVTCYQLKNNELIKKVAFEVKQGKNVYFVNILKQSTKGKVKIKVVDEENHIIPYAEIQIKYSDNTVKNLKSDENGEIEIEDAPFKEDIVIRQIIDKLPQYQQIVRFSDDVRVFEFKGKRVKTPFDYTKLIVNVLMHNDEPISNLKVRIDNGVNMYNQVTDSFGNAIFEKLDCSKSIIVTVDNKGKKKSEEIKCQGAETKHIIKYSSNIGKMWLWILLALIAIVLAILLIPKINFKITKPVKDTTQQQIHDTVKVDDYKGMKIIIINENNIPVKNCKVDVIFNDSTYSKTTDDKGEVIFEDMTDTTKLITSKVIAQNYTEQLLTFKIAHVKVIKLRTESVEYSEEVLPCGTLVESKGYHSTIKTFNLKKTTGKFKLVYDMFDIPDKIVVYKGSAKTISKENIIWDPLNFEKKLHTVYIDFNSPDSLITIEIQGGDTTSTEWYFKVMCP